MNLQDALRIIPENIRFKFVGNPPLLIIFSKALEHMDMVNLYKIPIDSINLRTGFGENKKGKLNLLPDISSSHPYLVYVSISVFKNDKILFSDYPIIF